MKFSIKYSKLGNKFFFISNLSEWHFSCRPKYNELWINEIGKMTDIELIYLGKFKKILQKYSFDKYLGLYFIVPAQENIVWKKLKDQISNEEFQIIKETFEVFENKFNQIWKPDLLQKNVKVLQEEINKNSKNIFNNLEKLFGKISKKNINVYLISHPDENFIISGGANLKNNGITLECNRLDVKDDCVLDNTISIIYHELLHMLYGRKVRIIADFFYQNNKSLLIPYRSAKNLMEEIIAHSLFSNLGYLSNKYLYKKSQKILFKKINDYINNFNDLKTKNITNISRNHELFLYYYVAFKINPLIKSYLDDNKKIDKNFIFKITNILEN